MDPVVVELLERIIARNAYVPLPGLIVHLIERSDTIGRGRDLAGCILVETADGIYRRISAAELVALVELDPWVKRWRLDDGVIAASPF